MYIKFVKLKIIDILIIYRFIISLFLFFNFKVNKWFVEFYDVYKLILIICFNKLFFNIF